MSRGTSCGGWRGRLAYHSAPTYLAVQGVGRRRLHALTFSLERVLASPPSVFVSLAQGAVIDISTTARPDRFGSSGRVAITPSTLVAGEQTRAGRRFSGNSGMPPKYGRHVAGRARSPEHRYAGRRPGQGAEVGESPDPMSPNARVPAGPDHLDGTIVVHRDHEEPVPWNAPPAVRARDAARRPAPDEAPKASLPDFIRADRCSS